MNTTLAEAPSNPGIAKQPASERMMGFLHRGLESFRPSEHFESVAAIGADHMIRLISDGRSVFISDIDGTVTANGSFVIEDATQETYRAITSNPNAKLYLWTNIAGKTEEELIRLQYIAETLSAELVTYRDAPDETKPSPAKIHAIIAHANNKRDDDQPLLTTANVVMIGDKLTADVRAGNFARDADTNIAGVHTIWVDRLGPANTDLVGDRLLRRPTEKLLWFLMGLLENSDHVPAKTDKYPVVVKTFDRQKLARGEAPALQEEIAVRSLIANVGNGPKLDVPEEIFATLPPPRTEPLHSMRRAIKESRIMRAAVARAEVHGKRDANIITLSRFVGIPFVLGAKVLEWRRTAATLFAGLAFGDLVDGFDSKHYFRKHPEEKKTNSTERSNAVVKVKAPLWDRNLSLPENIRGFIARLNQDMEDVDWGARNDPKADKGLANSVEALLAVENPELVNFTGAIIVRDVIRERFQRPYFERRGFTAMDLRATPSSRASTLILNTAITTSLFSKNKKLQKTTHAAAAGYKVYSLFASMKEWKRRKQFREDAEKARVLLSEEYRTTT